MTSEEDQKMVAAVLAFARALNDYESAARHGWLSRRYASELVKSAVAFSRDVIQIDLDLGVLGKVAEIEVPEEAKYAHDTLLDTLSESAGERLFHQFTGRTVREVREEQKREDDERRREEERRKALSDPTHVPDALKKPEPGSLGDAIEKGEIPF